jgi:hypothetical protein
VVRVLQTHGGATSRCAREAGVTSSYWCTLVWSAGSPDREAAWTLVPVRDRRAPPDVAVISTVGRRLRVAARGEFDLVTAPLLDVAVREVYWRTPAVRPGRFVLDLTGVTFLDVSGVRALERIDGIVRDHDGLLDVAGPAAYGPCRLLDLAVDHGWLSGAFAFGAGGGRATVH